MAIVAAAAYGLAIFGVGLWFIRKHRIEDEKAHRLPQSYHHSEHEERRPERREVAMSGVK